MDNSNGIFSGAGHERRTIGFIGCGNMARPIIVGVAEKGVFERKNIYVYDPLTEPLEDFCGDLGINAASNEKECACRDVVMLCVKPQMFPAVLPLIAGTVRENGSLVVSIAAGKTTETIGSYLGADVPVARIFPNLNATVGEAVSAYTGNSLVAEDMLDMVKRICSSFGEAMFLPETDFSAFGVLGGCSPAYTFLYISALAQAAENAGLSAETASAAAVQAVLGSAELIKKLGGDLGEWVKKVCSPGGTTVEGVKILENEGLGELIGRAFDASFRRDLELSGGK